MKGKLIFDFQSKRRKDENGFLHVDACNISKAQVADYLGEEIGFSDLEPKKLYKVFRPESELSKAETVKSLNGVPIQLEHHDDFADAPATFTRIGATGTDAEYCAPYLRNSLHFFNKKAIDLIENGSKQELSLGYTADIEREKGTYENVPYDFVMRNIKINHVALVDLGRAGCDVRVADDATRLINPDETEEHKSMEEMKDLEALDLVKADVPETEEAEKVEQVETAETVEDTEAEQVQDADNEILEKIGEIDLNGDAEEIKAKLCEIWGKVESVDDECKTDAEPVEGEELILQAKAKLQELELDPENEDLISAFVAGVDFVKAEQVEQTEATEQVEEEEQEAEKTLTADSAKKVYESIKADFNERIKAGNAVRGVLGNIDLTAYDSAGAIYIDACKAMGVDVNGMNGKECRATFNALQSMKAKRPVTKDSAPKASKLDAIFANVRIME